MKKFRDDIAMVCHEIIKDGHQLGIVTDAEMKDFEKNCFVDEPATAPQSASARMTITPALAKRG